MKKFDRISSVILSFLSVWVCIEAVRLEIGTPNSPAPGFFPFIAGLAMGLFSILIFLKTFKMDKGTATFWVADAERRAIVLSICTMIGYAQFVEILGFMLTTILFFFSISRVIARKGWSFTVIYSFASSAGVYVVFSELFKAPLPLGIFGGFF